MNEVSSAQTQGYVQQQPMKVNGVNGTVRNSFADPDLLTREIIDADGTIRKVSINIPQQL